MNRKKLRILQVCSSNSWGGMEMVAVQTARKLKERGHTVSFLAGADSQSEKALKDSDIFLFPIADKGYVDPLGVIKISNWIRERKIDIVHAHYSKDIWKLVPALSDEREIPLVLTKHIGTMKPKKDFFHCLIYRRVDAVIGISKLIQQNVIRTHPIAPDKVTWIPNGVDLRVFDKKKVDRNSVRTSLGIPLDALVVGIAGRLNWWKGYREFLEMAHQIAKLRPSVYFIAVGGATVGEEKEAEEIQNFARSLNLGKNLIFTGFRKDMVNLFSAMDIFVYPAYAEAFGLVLIEAMSLGLPVISSNCDGVPEIVVDGETGKLVPPRNSEILTKTVLEILDNREKMKRFGSAGKDRVLKIYDLDKVISQTEKLYEKLLSERRKYGRRNVG